MPLREPCAFSARIGWPEPIGRTEDIAAATLRLLATLCRELERRQLGIRAWRSGCTGSTARSPASPSAPAARCATPASVPPARPRAGRRRHRLRCRVHAARGPGDRPRRPPGRPRRRRRRRRARPLVDQLAQRLGAARVVRLQPVDSHVPERAQALVPAGAALGPAPGSPASPGPCACSPTPGRSRPWRACPTGRPCGCPPPRAPRVLAAAGPERILPEWWRGEPGRPRDYYRVATADRRLLGQPRGH